MQHAADLKPIPPEGPYGERRKTALTRWKNFHFGKPLLARETGLEPATSGVTGRRSNQLSYSRSGRRRGLGWGWGGVKAQFGRRAKITTCG